jgi:lipopolysaccharide export system protein LptA
MTRGLTMLQVCACAVFACAPIANIALAQKPQQQSEQSVPNALQGFSQNKDQPVKIEAASLEVRDKEKIATFSGNVVVTQGDTTMKCKSLIVHYDTDSKSSSGMKTAQPGPGGNSSIKKLEALGGVFVTQKDQTATGDKGLFDMKSNSITLSGNVLITQNQNVLKGERLVVDMTTGAARVEGGRVTGVFVPGSTDKDSKDKDKDGKDKDKDKDAGKNKDSGKAKDTGKAKTTGKSSNAAKPADTKSVEKEDVAAPATIPARPASAATQPSPRNTTASTRRTPATRDANAVVESTPATPETTPAPAFAPTPRGGVATPERSNPVAPRGIY